MRIRGFTALTVTALWLGGCASGPRDIPPEKEKLIDKLTLFVEAVQTDKFPEAFAYLTPEEKAKMMASGGEVSDHVKRQLRAVRLSTLANKQTVRLVSGKLEGIYEQLPMIDDAPAGPRQPVTDVPLLQ